MGHSSPLNARSSTYGTAGLKHSAAEQIHAAWSKALDRRSDDPEGAITAARTLLETVCKHLLDELGETYDDKADLPKLYSLVAAKLRLPEFFKNEAELRAIWSAPDTRAKLMAGLGEKGFGRDQMAEMQ